MIRLRLWIFERQTALVKRHFHHMRGTRRWHDFALLMLTRAETASVGFLRWYSCFSPLCMQPTLKEWRVMLPLPESGVQPVFFRRPWNFSHLTVFSLDLTFSLSYHPISLFPLRFCKRAIYIPGPPFSLEPAPIKLSPPTALLKYLSSRVTEAESNGQFSVSSYLIQLITPSSSKHFLYF